MKNAPALSEKLADLIKLLSEHTGKAEVTVTGQSFDTLVQTLKTTRLMAVSIEREVGALRLAEVAREGRASVEQLAQDQFVGLVVDPEGKVIRPNFRGKS